MVENMYKVGDLGLAEIGQPKRKIGFVFPFGELGLEKEKSRKNGKLENENQKQFFILNRPYMPSYD